MTPAQPTPRRPRRSALFIIDSNPVTSHRPAEAVRIAAGIRAWHHLDVHVYLHDNASKPLVECQDQIKDPDSFRHYLPLLGDSKETVVYVSDRLGLRTFDLWGDPFSVHPIADDSIAQRAASSTWVLRF